MNNIILSSIGEDLANGTLDYYYYIYISTQVNLWRQSILIYKEFCISIRKNIKGSIKRPRTLFEYK